MRVTGFGHPFALDFGAMMMVGKARGADTNLLAELLPEIEQSVISSSTGDGPAEEDENG